MIIYHVKRTEKTPNYNEAVFIDTLGGIYTEAPGMGFFKHPDITTPAQLRAHLDALKTEGFQIKKHTVCANLAF